MVFASLTFLWIFLPSVIVLYYFPGILKKQKIRNFLLLFASLFFYAFGEPRLIVLLLLCVLINYTGGLMIAGCEGRLRKAALFFTVALSLSMLGYYKYSGFLTETLSRITGLSFPERIIVLPVGISFYTFQALSYTIDLYRGRCEVQRSFVKLLLYISFFPQLIAGPIVRYRDFAAQIDHRETDTEKLAEGISRFITGLGKKVLLANVFASRADFIFGMPDAERSAALAWAGVLLYTLQIYFDFSGYSDMAIGMGKMFGFDFRENFDMPYTSASVSEFWRRWHISLSSWFREYLYIPLGGSRLGVRRTCLNLMIVFFATGLWHGAGWNFIVWGMVHGMLVVTERILHADRTEHLKGLHILLRRLLTLTAAALCWVLFRAETLTNAGGYYRSMFAAGGSAFSTLEVLGIRGMVMLLAGILLGIVIPGNLQKQFRQSPLSQALLQPLVLLLSVMYLAAESYNPFIYFRF